MNKEPLEKFNDDVGMERFKKWLSSIGDVVAMYAFAPEDIIRTASSFLYQHGFFPVSCPMVVDKTKIEAREREDLHRLLRGEKELESNQDFSIPPINTTDEIMIKQATHVIGEMPDITHICIASGDGDFLPIAKLAKSKGKKIMLMIGNYRSPSKVLLRQADKGIDGVKMVHVFNPIIE